MNVDEYKSLISKKKKKRYSQAAWAVVDDQKYYFRSSWEKKFAHYLQYLKENKKIIEWQYEPKTFWFKGIKRGAVSYKPDFKVTEIDLTHTWIEVKGYMDQRSKTKIKRFGKYFPKEILLVVEKKWFVRNNPKLKNLVTGWE